MISLDYVKVLMRRCQAYEKTNKIDEALADAKKVQELDSSYPKVSLSLPLFTLLFLSLSLSPPLQSPSLLQYHNYNITD